MNRSIQQNSNDDHCVVFRDVLDASTKIKDIARRTDVMTCSSLDQLTNNQRLFFKVEALQRTGSFKFRGALNAILSLMEDCAGAPQSGSNGDTVVHVVTHSSGNHAAAVALAARLASEKTRRKVEATIVMPENAPLIKVNGVKGFGGNIVFVESTNEERETMADCIVKQKGAEFIHPSEDKRVIAGQGTVCLEFVEQVREMVGFVGGDLDAVIIPVGGGGLAAGNAVALRGLLGKHVKIILAEPMEMDDAKRSKEAGVLLKHDSDNKLNSVADGLKTTLGPNTWPIIRDLVDEIITVSEEDILRATKLIWERLKVCIEPSAGVGVAVALGQEFQMKYRSEDGISKVGIILCGGNVDVLKMSQLMIDRGL